MFNEKLNNLSQEIRANSDSISQLTDTTRDSWREINCQSRHSRGKIKYIKGSVEF